jgi:hypothetical protein
MAVTSLSSQEDGDAQNPAYRLASHLSRSTVFSIGRPCIAADADTAFDAFDEFDETFPSP